MPTNNMVYSLAEPNKIGDTSWIKPGKVAWDWWNDWNLQGVNFEAGINMATYQYYIDFAEKNHLEYIVLDEGWYDSNKGDIMHSIPAIDLPKLIAYGKQKGVDIVLWAVFNVLDEHLSRSMVNGLPLPPNCHWHLDSRVSNSLVRGNYRRSGRNPTNTPVRCSPHTPCQTDN